MIAGVVAAVLTVGGLVAASTPAIATDGSGGASVPGSGGTVGNVRTFGWFFDRPSGADRAPAQGYDQASMEWFFANHPAGSAPDTSSTPNAYQAMQTACRVALDRADARQGGSPGSSRVVGMFHASSAVPANVWNHGLEMPAHYQGLYDGWAAAGRPGILTAADGVSDLTKYHGMIDAAMAEAIADANGQPIRAICLALNQAEPPMTYSLSATTTAMDTFAVAGGDAPVFDMLHMSNGGSPILENVTATTVLRYWGVDGSTAEASKSKSVPNNGDSPSETFSPADFGWKDWTEIPASGEMCFDLHVPKQGHMDAALDTLNRPDFRSYREPCPAGAGWPDSWSA